MGCAQSAGVTPLMDDAVLDALRDHDVINTGTARAVTSMYARLDRKCHGWVATGSIAAELKVQVTPQLLLVWGVRPGDAPGPITRRLSGVEEAAAATAPPGLGQYRIPRALFIRGALAFCAVEPSKLAAVAFACYDRDNRGIVSKHSLIEQLRETDGIGFGVSDLVKALDEMTGVDSFSEFALSAFAKTHPLIYYSTFTLHSKLRRRLGGEKAWETRETPKGAAWRLDRVRGEWERRVLHRDRRRGSHYSGNSQQRTARAAKRASHSRSRSAAAAYAVGRERPTNENSDGGPGAGSAALNIRLMEESVHSRRRSFVVSGRETDDLLQPQRPKRPGQRRHHSASLQLTSSFQREAAAALASDGGASSAGDERAAAAPPTGRTARAGSVNATLRPEARRKSSMLSHAARAERYQKQRMRRSVNNAAFSGPPARKSLAGSSDGSQGGKSQDSHRGRARRRKRADGDGEADDKGESAGEAAAT